jgi:hypothetical protein
VVAVVVGKALVAVAGVAVVVGAAVGGVLDGVVGVVVWAMEVVVGAGDAVRLAAREWCTAIATPSNAASVSTTRASKATVRRDDMVIEGDPVS